MLFALGAASTALDVIQNLASSASSSAPSQGSGDQASASPFAITAPTSAPAGSTPVAGFAAGSQISPATLNALLAAQNQSSTAASASTSASSATDALQNPFAQIDANGDGSVSLDDLSSALKEAASKTGHHGHHHVVHSGDSGSADGSSGSSTDPLLQASQGGSATSASSSGAQAAASGIATAFYNSVDQLFQRQAGAISFSVAPLSFSV